MSNDLHSGGITAKSSLMTLKGLWALPILLLLAGLATDALADTAKARPRLKMPVSPPIASNSYKDLPGVKRPEDVVEENPYACNTALAETRGYGYNESARHHSRHRDYRRYRDGLWDDGLPVLVYRCTRGAVTFESTRQPVSKEWFPGINPRDLSDDY